MVARTVYAGSFTSVIGGAGEGITTVSATPTSLMARGEVPAGCPTFLAQHPTRDVLYAASESPDGEVYSFAIEPDGALRSLGVKTTGPSPAHIAIGLVGDRHFAVTSHYWGGCFAVHPVEADGSLGTLAFLLDRNADRGKRAESRAHSAVFAPSGEFLLAADLGRDEVITYRIEPATGVLEQLSVAAAPSGAGPRHLAWHSDGRVFVSGERDASILTYVVDAAGTLTFVESRPSLAFPERVSTGAPISQPSEIALSHGGRFLHLANRRTNVISTFDTREGRLRPVADTPTGGDQPRHFAIVGDELYVGNQGTSSIRAFIVDPASGVPTATGAQLDVTHVACIVVRR